MRTAALVLSLLTISFVAACRLNADGANSMLQYYLNTDADFPIEWVENGDGCSVAQFEWTPSVPFGLDGAGDIDTSAPSVAYAIEHASVIQMDGSHFDQINARYSVASARNCFHDRNHFHTLLELTPSVVGVARSGNVVIVRPSSDPWTGYLILGSN